MAHFAEIARKSRPGVRPNERLEHPEWGSRPTRLQDGTGGDRLEALGSRYRSRRGLESLTTTTRERRGLRYVTRARGWS
jgi:hypothetical protein